ncbi:histone PARylation factor 1 [Tetranychus urticae]|uniref:Histone PARylation factor 1 n=1 Tax=Tetranychus urticae TaxID=32264 RepID=T1K1U1_TETUR|nr:histone PARylation factor 1 [Tetranychus urticae]
MFAKKPKTVDTNQLNERMEKYFLVKMPDDFFKFWSFCSSLNPLNPKAALHTLDLLLVGPFDVIDGKLKDEVLDSADPASILCYYRFFYDVPEFQTVLRDTKSNFHIGYFRDSPSEMPSMVVSNDPDKSCIINPLGDNIFSGLLAFCEDLKRRRSEKDDKKANAEKLSLKIKAYAEKNDIPLVNNNMKERKKKVVAKTFHGAGIVVPFENDVGYRPLPENEQNLKKLLKKIADMPEEDRQRSKAYESLREIVNLTNLANDECDFGMALELGIDLFCFGEECYHRLVSFTLGTAYELLDRHQFGTIIEAHLANRRNEKLMKFSIKGGSTSA